MWNFHGEDPSLPGSENNSHDDESSMCIDCNELSHDRYRDACEGSSRDKGPTEDVKRFYKLLEKGKQDLYLGWKTFTRPSFIIKLFLFKTLHGLSNVAFNDLLQLIKEIIPEVNAPNNFNEARKVVRDLGFDYKKIYACPNRCMLYWKKNENLEECRVCHTSK